MLVEQKMFIIVFCISAILFSLLLTYVFSEKYKTATTILYRPQEVMRLRAQETKAFGAPLPAAPFKSINQNLQELVMSEAILRPVVEQLRLDQKTDPEYTGAWYKQLFEKTKDLVKEYRSKLMMLLKYGRIIDEDPTVAAIKGLRENVALVNKNSYVFHLIVTDKDPARGATIADSIAQELVGWLRKDQKRPAELKQKKIKMLLNAKSDEMKDYQLQIEEILTKNNMASISIETERTMERLSDLELSRIKLESEIRHTKAKLSTVDDYKKQKGRIRQTSKDPSIRSSPIQPEDYKRLSSEKLFTEIELSAMEPKLDSLKASVRKLEDKLRELPNIQRKLDKLKILLETAKHDYVQLSDAFQEATVQATSDQSEVFIIQKALVPSIPTSPVKIYHVSLSAVLSLLVSTGLVYLLSYANIRFLFAPVTSSRPILIGQVMGELQQNQYIASDRREIMDRRKLSDRRKDPALLSDKSKLDYSGPLRRQSDDRRGKSGHGKE